MRPGTKGIKIVWCNHGASAKCSVTQTAKIAALMAHRIALLFAFGFVVGFAVMSPPFTFRLDDNASVFQLALYFVECGFFVLLLASHLDLFRRLKAETAIKETLFHELQHRVEQTAAGAAG